MHCRGHNTVRGSQLASKGWYFRRVKNIVSYLEGRTTRNSLPLTNLRCFCLMQDQFFFQYSWVDFTLKLDIVNSSQIFTRDGTERYAKSQIA